MLRKCTGLSQTFSRHFFRKTQRYEIVISVCETTWLKRFSFFVLNRKGNVSVLFFAVFRSQKKRTFFATTNQARKQFLLPVSFFSSSVFVSLLSFSYGYSWNKNEKKLNLKIQIKTKKKFSWNFLAKSKEKHVANMSNKWTKVAGPKMRLAKTPVCNFNE